jgi:hypothetical protein
MKVHAEENQGEGSRRRPFLDSNSARCILLRPDAPARLQARDADPGGGTISGRNDLAGAPGKVRFDDPDFAIDIETIDGRAGMSTWSREDLRAYEFLRVG